MFFMPRKRAVRKTTKPNAKKRVLATIASHLNKRLAEPLNHETVLAEAKRLFKIYRFTDELDQIYKLPLKAVREMGQFLVIKGAQKADLTPKEISALMEIIDPRKERIDAEEKRIAAILAKMPKGFAEKVLQTRAYSNAIYDLNIDLFRKEKNGDELYHIAKFGVNRAFHIFEYLEVMFQKIAVK